MRPRPATEVITHGFPVGELDAADSPTAASFTVGRVARHGESRPRRSTDITTGSAAIHAAAVTAAARPISQVSVR